MASWQKDGSPELTAFSSRPELNARNHADKFSRTMAAGTNVRCWGKPT